MASLTIEGGTPMLVAQTTVSTAAISLPSAPSSANCAIVQIETQGNCRWADDTSTPTATVGMLLYAGNYVTINDQKSIAQFKIIRSDSVDVTLNVSYYIRA